MWQYSWEEISVIVYIQRRYDDNSCDIPANGYFYFVLSESRHASSCRGAFKRAKHPGSDDKAPFFFFV